MSSEWVVSWKDVDEDLSLIRHGGHATGGYLDYDEATTQKSSVGTRLSMEGEVSVPECTT